MMQVVPKWRVTVTFVDRLVVVFIADNHIENVLRTVAGIQWSENVLESPREIIVAAQEDTP